MVITVPHISVIYDTEAELDGQLPWVVSFQPGNREWRYANFAELANSLHLNHHEVAEHITSNQGTIT